MEDQRAGDMEGAAHVAECNSLAPFASSSSSSLLLTTTTTAKPLSPQPAMSAPALFYSLLAFTIAVLTLHATIINADHFTCTWKPHDGSPEKFNYTQFCRAQLLRDNSDNNLGDWVCAAGNVAPVGTKVADYSRLRKGILEMGECAREGLTVTSLPPDTLVMLSPVQLLHVHTADTLLTRELAFRTLSQCAGGLQAKVPASTRTPKTTVRTRLDATAAARATAD